MIDLHSHSTVSDGTDSPEHVIEMSRAAGLAALALTDHDTLEHVAVAQAAARTCGVRFVPGCEISCELEGRAPGTMHLLVYFIDDGVGPLQDRLDELQAGRNERNEKIVAALRAHGIEVTIDDVHAKAGPGSVGRPHVARVLMEKGYVSSIQEAFDVWLARGRPAYYERPRLTPETAIELAHQSGGVCSIAHPATLGLDGEYVEAFIGVLTDTGLDALECEYGAYTLEERSAWRVLAERHGLALTGGSDYHGENKPGLALGVGRGDLQVPDGLLDALEARRR